MTRLSFRPCRWLAALALAAALPAAATADVDLPPVDQVFVLSAKASARDRIEVRWQIAAGYYLYRHRTSVKADGFGDATLALPEGAKHHDEFFGDVQTYRKQLIGVVSGRADASANAVKLTVKYQGCADAGVCYPPQTRTLTVALPAADDAAPGLGFAKKSGGLFGLGDPAGAVDAAPLPPEQAFTSEVIALDGNHLLLRLTPAKGYYLYRDKLSVRLQAGNGLSTALPSAAALPAASPYKDEHFGKVAVYFDQVEIKLPVLRTQPQAATGTLHVGLQGCQIDGICYPPMTRMLDVALPAGTVTPAPATAQPQGNTSPIPAPPLPAHAADATASIPATTRAGFGEDRDAATRKTPQFVRETPPTQQTLSLLAALLLALLGGLILNLMPCVLPVLSLKALSLLQGSESPHQPRQHVLAYTAGVLLSMLALGGLVLALRQAGLALGWGFQLQQPLVLAVLALVMLALGLSLSGMWQATIALGSRSSTLVQGSGLRADFFTGVLAVVLATPCTAPFMGPALAYAFAGPLLGGLLVFVMLGLGLALPFLAIGFMPALARLLPKPGAWMDTFKQMLAFPLYATAAWLVWVLTQLRGADATGLWLTAAITLAFALWAWTKARTTAHRGWWLVAALAALTLSWPLHTLHRLPKPQASHTATTANAPMPWSEATLALLRAQHRVVFVDMTADWCITCKVNEKAVFSQPRFQQTLADTHAVYMVGDYTDVDPAMSAYLQRYRAVGVPLYVVYPRNGGEGRVLPTLLTPAIADTALREAAR